MLRKEPLTFSADRTIPLGLVDLLEGGPSPEPGTSGTSRTATLLTLLSDPITHSISFQQPATPL